MIFTYKGDRSIGGLQTEPFVSDSLGEYFEDVFLLPVMEEVGKTRNQWTPQLMDLVTMLV